jgi:hypothetical protein
VRRPRWLLGARIVTLIQGPVNRKVREGFGPPTSERPVLRCRSNVHYRTASSRLCAIYENGSTVKALLFPQCSPSVGHDAGARPSAAVPISCSFCACRGVLVLKCRRKIPLSIYPRTQAHDVQCNRRRMSRRGWASQSISGPQDHGTDRERLPLDLLHRALWPAVGKSGRRWYHLLSPCRRGRSVQKRPVIDLVAEHHVESDQELARDGDLGTGTAPAMEHRVVEALQDPRGA